MSAEIIIPCSTLSDMPALWVCLRALRMWRCEAKITVCGPSAWKFTPLITALVDGLEGVRFREMPPMKIQWHEDFWKLALQGMLGSDSQNVLVFDPHNIPLRNPVEVLESLEFQEAGVLFWPKYTTPVDRSMARSRFNLPAQFGPEVDGSIFALAKNQHHEALHKAVAMLETEHLAEVLWGNLPDVLQYTWLSLGLPIAGVTTRPQPLFFIGIDFHLFLAGMCHFDLDGEQLLQNRRRYPLRLSDQQSLAGGLLEPQVFRWLDELRARWVPLLPLAVAVAHQGRWLLDWHLRYLQPERSKVRAEVLDLDDWATLTLDPDGIVQGPRETEISFWRREGTEKLALLNAELEVIALLEPASRMVMLGTWTANGTRCRMTRLDAVMLASERRLLGQDGLPEVNEGVVHLQDRGRSLADSIGDLFGACALAASGADVIFHTPHSEWFYRMGHPGLAITRVTDESAEAEGAVEPEFTDEKPPVDLVLNRNVETFGKLGVGPIAARCRNLGDGVRPMLPAIINRVLEQRRMDLSRYVVIVPYCDQPRIDWPKGHWHRLISHLRGEGVDVVAIGEQEHAQEFAREFMDSYAFWAHGDSTAWTLDVLLEAEAIIAPNCGLAHLAALHGVRTICLCAEFSAEYFPRELRIEAVGSGAECDGCWRNPDRGYLQSCRVSCAALGAITPERVIEQFRSGNPSHES